MGSMSGSSRYKVVRVAEKYGLDSIGDELLERWTRKENRLSLRDLATYFNQRILRVAMEEAGLDPLDGEVENIYRLLSEEEISSGVRTETRKRLERDGVNISRIETDFLTYQAIHSYLTEKRDASVHTPTDDERVEAVNKSIKQLQNRTLSVSDEKLQSLRDKDRLGIGQFRVTLELRVFCGDCGNQYEISELIEQGSCECER